MRRQLIVGTAVTGLNPEIHEIWELGVIELGADGQRTEHLWRMKPELEAADPGALQVGGFYERTTAMRDFFGDGHVCDLIRDDPEWDSSHWSDPGALALTAARMLDGATLIAANPAFDAGFLAQFLHDNRQAATWHYRLRDIGSMAWAYLSALIQAKAIAPPPELPAIDASTDDFARALGIDPGSFERHSALGDCKLILAMLDVIEGRSA